MSIVGDIQQVLCRTTSAVFDVSKSVFLEGTTSTTF